MDVASIMNFLAALRCTKISMGSRWVRSTCPLYHLHTGGQDRSPSFAVSINPDDESHYRCLGCNKAGSLRSLLWRLEADRGEKFIRLFDMLTHKNQINPDKFNDIDQREPDPGDLEGQLRYTRKYVPTHVRQVQRQRLEQEPQAEVPEEDLALLISQMTPEVLEYLQRIPDPLRGVEGRQLTLETIRAWELGWQPTVGRLAIPIRDEDGKLVALSGRRLFGRGYGPKYLHTRFKRDRILFGEHKRVPSIRKGYLFEGFFQAIFSWQVGYRNVFARMGTHLSALQALKLVKWLDELVIVPDGDAAGRHAAEQDRRTLEMLEVEHEGRVCKLQKIEVAPMIKNKDADILPPQILRDVMGPLNSA